MKKKRELCPDCTVRPRQKHFNSKWCLECALKRRKRPVGKLTKEQERIVRQWAGKVYQAEVALKAKTSRTNLIRWARDNGLSLNAHAHKEDVIKQVTAYYEKHGKVKTQKKFPNIRVRSIVEKYRLFAPRQSRWTDKQLHELVQFAGIIKADDQAKYFNRPLANRGSITSAWMKKFGHSPGPIHGMPEYKAKLFVTSRCPKIETPYRTTSKRKNLKHPGFSRKLYLWVDMEKHLRPDCPDFIADAIRSMAEFQRWIYRTKYVRRKVLKMINEVST